MSDSDDDFAPAVSVLASTHEDACDQASAEIGDRPKIAAGKKRTTAGKAAPAPAPDALVVTGPKKLSSPLDGSILLPETNLAMSVMMETPEMFTTMVGMCGALLENVTLYLRNDATFRGIVVDALDPSKSSITVARLACPVTFYPNARGDVPTVLPVTLHIATLQRALKRVKGNQTLCLYQVDSCPELTVASFDATLSTKFRNITTLDEAIPQDVIKQKLSFQYQMSLPINDVKSTLHELSEMGAGKVQVSLRDAGDVKMLCFAGSSTGGEAFSCTPVPVVDDLHSSALPPRGRDASSNVAMVGDVCARVQGTVGGAADRGGPRVPTRKEDILKLKELYSMQYSVKYLDTVLKRILESGQMTMLFGASAGGAGGSKNEELLVIKFALDAVSFVSFILCPVLEE